MTDIYIGTHFVVSENPSPHLFLLSFLQAQLSVGRRHRLDHESGGHVADRGQDAG